MRLHYLEDEHRKRLEECLHYICVRDDISGICASFPTTYVSSPIVLACDEGRAVECLKAYANTPRFVSPLKRYNGSLVGFNVDREPRFKNLSLAKYYDSATEWAVAAQRLNPVSI